MRYIGASLFIVGAAAGVWCTVMLRDMRRRLLEKAFDETVIEQGQEIARLRAQVAMLVGKEGGR